MKKKRTKKIRIVESGKVYIIATFNNTLITITDMDGKVIATGSCGMFGFKGTRKSTPYAATITVETTLKKTINDNKLKEVEVYVKGIGPGRQAALRVLKNIDLDITKVVDITPVPHNGVRPPKLRRN